MAKGIFAGAARESEAVAESLCLGSGLSRPDSPLASDNAMYAVIASGGKQEKVAEGQQVRVELLDADEGSDVSLTPVMVVDGSTVLATPDELKSASVTGRIVGQVKGPKINGYTFKRRTNQRASLRARRPRR
jgi:large subunit ribosomal protein L21